jgi:tetratricopeptide (TPR) repeat protein
MVVLMLGVPLGMCPLLPLLFPLDMPDFSDTRGAFHLKDGGWTPGPRFPGGLWGLQVSGKGAVWSIANSRGGLCRLDGGHWTRFGERQFGSSTDWLRGGFALRDEEVWGATDGGVVRFDGQSWRLYTDALKTGRPAATVAGSSGVWIIDDDGNLSHFDGNSWTIRSLSGVVPAATPASEDSSDRSPRLAMTGDGRLWVSWRGLWRQDGEAWREVRSPGLNLAEVRPIGHDAENVWLRLWRTGEVAAVTPDGRVAARYGWREMGLPKRAGINGLAARNGGIWIATSSGLLTNGSGRWRNLGRPPGCTTITDVALAPDGSVWVLGEKRSLARIARYFGPPLGAGTMALIVIGLLISAWLQGRAENMLAAEQALVAAAGYLPGVDVATGQADIDRQARSVRWKLCAALVGVPFVVFAVKEAAWRLWPDAPAWAPYGGLLAIVALACLGIWLRNSHRRRSAQGRAEQPKSSRFRVAIWRPAKWMLFGAILLLCGLVPLGWVDRLIPVAALAGLVKLVVVIVLFSLIATGRENVAVLVAKPAWRAGDYDRALRWTRRMGFGRPSAKLIQIEGLTHSLAGRPAEAERCYREALARGYALSRADRVGLLGCLGEALQDQGRFEESVKCRQASIDMGDNILGSARHGLAELLLKQGTEPQRALELVDEAMRVARGPAAPKFAPSRWATRAWALASLGRRQEAEQAIAQAMLLRRETYAALFADTRLTVGMALLAMDQPEKALEHFRAAREADPKGKNGVRALQQIERLGAGGR